MRQERLAVRIRLKPARFRVFHAAVTRVAAVEADFMQAVRQLADLAVLLQFLRFGSQLGEIVVEVAAEVQLAVGRVLDQFARVADVGAERLFAEHLLAVGQRLHRRLKVERTVFIAACADRDRFEVRL